MFMRNIILALLILCPASSLCGQGQRVRSTLMHDGIQRNYITYVPSSYDPTLPMPLVLNFHGLMSTAGQQETLGMNEVAEREGFLLTYPSAVNRDWRISADHNIDFVETLLDTLAADYTVDAQRVYAAGGSQGGIMSFVLAAALPDRFAAAAPLAGPRLVSGDPNRHPTFLSNTPDRPFPLLYVHGTADTVVPYDGGISSEDDSFEFPSVFDVLDEWVDSNGGTALEPATTIPGFDVVDGPAVSLFQCNDCGSYSNAAGDEQLAEVIHMRINGLGHVWPEPDIIMLNSEIWNFFRRHELAVVPEPSADFDDDGDIDGADFLTWQRNFGTDAGIGNVAPHTDGNADGDHFIDGADLGIWEIQYGTDGSPPSGAANVPEPSTLLLASLAGLLFYSRRRRI